MKTATADQIATIRARRIDDAARAMMTSGVGLTYAQADDLGEEALDWLRTRLGLTVEETDSGVVASARTWSVGDRVQGGEPGTEDHDTGRVDTVCDDGSVWVAWSNGERTRIEAYALTAAQA